MHLACAKKSHAPPAPETSSSGFDRDVARIPTVVFDELAADRALVERVRVV
jgi:hypothetical protein